MSRIASRGKNIRKKRAHVSVWAGTPTIIRIPPIIIKPPNLIITPIKESITGDIIGCSFQVDRPDRSGLLAGLLNFEDRRDPILDLDFGNLNERDAKEQALGFLDEMRKGTFGKPDIRDVIAERGDEAGIVAVLVLIGYQLAANPETARKIGEVGLKIIYAVAIGVVGSQISSAIDRYRFPPQNEAKPEAKAETKPEPRIEEEPKDGGSDDSKKPPKDDPKKRPREDEGGGRLTPGQIVRVRLWLKNYVPPMRDDREDKPKGKKVPTRPIDEKYDPAIDWGPDVGNLKKVVLTARIVANDGYTDPVPFTGR